MPVKKLPIQEFIIHSAGMPVFDVRSPGEYIHAQIPGAYSLPLFTDEERKIVGTAYKQEGKQKAIKIGLDFFGPKMRSIVDQVENIAGEFFKIDHEKKKASPTSPPHNKIPVLIHCWRGGMRSGAIAWLLDLYGFEVYTLAGGYKAYRNWALRAFEKNYDIKILGGYTGSGKTTILAELQKIDQAVIDLEKLANHKGSAFGGIGLGQQPSQEMFENLFATELYKKENEIFWVEDESQRIGHLNIPTTFWKQMREKPLFFIDIPFEQRLKYILEDYGLYSKDELHGSIERIQKRLGPLETKTALEHLQKDELEPCFSILLLYYDKMYKKGMQNRQNIEQLLNKIPANTVDSVLNTQKLLLCNAVST
jgi:tRNA 2-selenouridine synthase